MEARRCDARRNALPKAKKGLIGRRRVGIFGPVNGLRNAKFGYAFR